MKTPRSCIQPMPLIKERAQKEAKKLKISLAKWVELAMMEKLQRDKK